LLAKELLHESGSVFVQISDENVHRVRCLLDEVFGEENFFSEIVFKKNLPLGSAGLAGIFDYIICYAKDKTKIKYRQLYEDKPIGAGTGYTWVEEPTGIRRKMTSEERNDPSIISENCKIFFTSDLASSGYTPSCFYSFEMDGRLFEPTKRSWKTNYDGMMNLIAKKRIMASGKLPTYIRYFDDFPMQELHNMWDDTHGASDLIYVVQTSQKPIQRCILMSTDPSDLILDITCGSGTTAFVAEQWGRRWITCDTSRVAVALAKQRLLTADYDYYPFAQRDEGISSGFQYKTVPHITLKSIANNEPPGIEVLFDHPKVDNSKARVTGPFTVESIPAPFVKNLDKDSDGQSYADESVTRSGETLRQDEWRDELQRTGARGKGGAILQFSRIETQEGTRYIQAVGETKEAKPQKVLIVFGTEHAPLDTRVVELAIEEARQLKPNILLFCAFQFDEEAAKDIDETPEKLLGFKLLKAIMNMDLQTEDLKKQKTGNQSFWLIGQPDVRVKDIEKGDNKGRVQIEVAGFDYYNPKTGEINSEGANKIAMWMLDTDYDGRSLFPRQIFFPMAGPKDGWAKLSKNLKAEIDEEKIEAFRGTVSLPFTPGKLIAVKIIDDRGIESLKIIKR
jgi:adenine-specific DNA-methyltransferase